MNDARLSLEGTTVGNFRVGRLLGRGGMGDVYEGADIKLGRQVAIKTVRKDRGFDDVSRVRFQREARILSSLDHPHICRVHEYIEGPDLDYLVLEYILGTTLTKSIENGLDKNSRMTIAKQATSALMAAHERGIIHRDLKPENIMLTETGGLKVLDFGISRYEVGPGDGEIYDQTLADEQGPLMAVDFKPDRTEGMARIPGSDSQTGVSQPSGTTQPGELIGTPAYMSPEQARGEGLTTASDMFSLGLVLHEVYSGERVFSTSRSLAVLLLRIQSGDYPVLSNVDVDLGELVEQLKSLDPVSRPTAAETLRRLNWIENKPQRRLRRRLAIGAVVFLVAVAVSLGFLSVRLSQEAQRANREAHMAQQVSQFVLDLFNHSTPAQTQGREVTAREILDTGVVRLRTALRDTPLVRARMLATVGDIYRKLSYYESAEALLREALELRREGLPGHHRDIADSNYQLGKLMAVLDRGEEAAHYLGAALQVYEAELGLNHTEVLMVGATLANVYQNIDDERAAELFERVRQVVADSQTVIDSRYLDAVFHLGEYQAIAGDLDDAEDLTLMATEQARILYDSDHPDLATFIESLGSLMHRLGRLAESEELLVEALVIRRKVFGENHPEVAAATTNLANTVAQQGRLSEARKLYSQALQITDLALGQDTVTAAVIHGNLCVVDMQQASYDSAEDQCAAALAIFRSKAPLRHEVFTITNNLATVYLYLNRLAEAESKLNEALAILDRQRPNDRANRGMVMTNLAEVSGKMGRTDRSLELYSDALDLMTVAFGSEHYAIGEILRGTAAVLLKVGRTKEAAEKSVWADGILTSALGPRHPLTAQTQAEMAQIKLAQSRFKEAVDLLEPALEILEGVWGVESPELVPFLETYAEALGSLGRREEAAAVRTRCDRIR